MRQVTFKLALIGRTLMEHGQSVDMHPCYIEVESPLEFSRLVCALEQAPRISFLHEHEGRKVISVQMDIFNERPVVYYSNIEKIGRYLAYGIRSGREESSVVDSITDTAHLYSPIVRVRTLPEKLKPGGSANGKYMGVELEDLDSLAKMSYGVENVIFPLFAFPSGKKWILGIFMNFNDEDNAYFCYVILDEDPKMPFLRHSTQNGTEPSFVSHPSDHGYSYIKIIRLKGEHPLVDHGIIQG